MTTTAFSPARSGCAAGLGRRGFADSSHLRFYGSSGATAPLRAAPPRRRPAAPSATAASTSTRRARVLQWASEVEGTLQRLEQVSQFCG